VINSEHNVNGIAREKPRPGLRIPHDIPHSRNLFFGIRGKSCRNHIYLSYNSQIIHTDRLFNKDRALFAKGLQPFPHKNQRHFSVVTGDLCSGVVTDGVDKGFGFAHVGFLI